MKPHPIVFSVFFVFLRFILRLTNFTRRVILTPFWDPHRLRAERESRSFRLSNFLHEFFCGINFSKFMQLFYPPSPILDDNWVLTASNPKSRHKFTSAARRHSNFNLIEWDVFLLKKTKKNLTASSNQLEEFCRNYVTI